MSFYGEIERFLELKEIVQGFLKTNFLPYAQDDKRHIEQAADSIKKYLLATLLIALVRYYHWDGKGVFFWFSNLSISFVIVLLIYLIFYLFFAPFFPTQNRFRHRKRLNLFFYHGLATLLVFVILQVTNTSSNMTSYMETNKWFANSEYADQLHIAIAVLLASSIGSLPIIANTVRVVAPETLSHFDQIAIRWAISCVAVTLVLTTILAADFSIKQIPTSSTTANSVIENAPASLAEALLNAWNEMLEAKQN